MIRRGVRFKAKGRDYSNQPSAISDQEEEGREQESGVRSQNVRVSRSSLKAEGEKKRL